jgi:hypothetical protein
VIPGEVLELIKGTPSLELPGLPAEGDLSCDGARFHSPRPMVVHAFRSAGEDAKTIHLCGTCADNVHLLMNLIKVGKVPWAARRCFGNTVRRVAEQAATEENHA